MNRETSECPCGLHNKNERKISIQQSSNIFGTYIGSSKYKLVDIRSLYLFKKSPELSHHIPVSHWRNWSKNRNLVGTVWSEGFLYKVALPELKISPIMYFVIHNLVVLSKILKIVVPFWLKIGNQFYRVKNRIFKILLFMAQQFSIFWITPLNCGWQNT